MLERLIEEAPMRYRVLFLLPALATAFVAVAIAALLSARRDAAVSPSRNGSNP